MNTHLLYFEHNVGISKKAKEDFTIFERSYLLVRKKENRIFTVDEIKKLPEVSKDYVHQNEWTIRKNSIQRVEKHLKKCGEFQNILDIGCGNGFFTNRLSSYAQNVVGVDINLLELNQASTAFANNKKITWLCADFFDNLIFNSPEFDLITFCCSFQYFANLEQTINRCFELLKPNGKIIIIDTAFYEENELERAKERSFEYYTKMGVPELINQYHHHRINDIKKYNIRNLFKKSIFDVLLKSKVISPFPCIEISK